jgi:hypothetical protein
MVIILPDIGSRYAGKIFNDEWMKEKGFLWTARGLNQPFQQARSAAIPFFIIKDNQ